MGNAVSLGSSTTSTPDATNGAKLAQVDSVEDSAEKIIGGFSLSDVIPSSPSPDRAALSADDSGTTDMSTAGFAGTSGANLFTTKNRGALVVWCEFGGSVSSAQVRIVYYDAANNPLFVGPALAFSPTTLRVSSSGDYLSEPLVVETFGAAKYRPYLASKGSGNVDIFAQPL